MGCWSHQDRLAEQDGADAVQDGADARPHGAPRLRLRRRRRAATAPSTNTAWKRCGGSRKSRSSSGISSIACATPRTRQSSTSSWRSTGRVRPRRTTSRRAEHVLSRAKASGASAPIKPDGNEPPVCESRRAVCLCALRLLCWRCSLDDGCIFRTRRDLEGERHDPDAIASGDELWLSGRRRPKASWPAIPMFGAHYRPRSSIIPTSAARWLIRSASGSARARPIASSSRASPVKRSRPRPIWSMRRAAICKALPCMIPRSTGLLPPLLNFKGYVALQAWRVSNWLWRQDRTDLALLLQSLSSDSLQVSIHPSASIGTSVFLDHATGIIVGSFVVIGDEVTILQNVTIGRKPRLRTARRGSAGASCSAPGNHSRRRQHRRLCQDRRRIGRDQRRAGRLHRGRSSRAPDQLPGCGSRAP